MSYILQFQPAKFIGLATFLLRADRGFREGDWVSGRPGSIVRVMKLSQECCVPQLILTLFWPAHHLR